VSRLPDLPGVLSAEQIAASADAIAARQLPSGLVLWFEQGHGDPWNHVEAAMALTVAGRIADAERAYDWLVANQHRDGSWYRYYLVDGIEDARFDTNFTAYVATGTWHHLLATGDAGFAETMWPAVDRAIEFVLGLQQPGGEIVWLRDEQRRPGAFALLTGSSSIHLSLACAVSLAGALGHERPDWELAGERLRHAIARRPHAFQSKHRWAMDWYYPVLSGAVRGNDARARIDARWDDFVLGGFGCRCVADQPWVTSAETAELAIALDAVGRPGDARRMLTWVQYLREADGAYWTGCVHPDELYYPDDERSTYSAAANVLAADALGGFTGASGLFRDAGRTVIDVEFEREG
jgi:hypothetical protein